jgi:hypothetical protein
VTYNNINPFSGGLTLSAAGVLSGKPTSSATAYNVTVTSSDNDDNGNDRIQDAKRVYRVSLIDKPMVYALNLSDAQDLVTSGKAGEAVSVKVTLTELVSASTALSTSNVSISLSSGKRALTGVSYQSITSENNKSVLTFTGTLPAGDSSSIVMTGLSLNNITLTGKNSGGTLSGRINNPVFNGVKVSSSYLLDNSAPQFSSSKTISVSANENSTAGLCTVVAKDANAVTYSLGGADAGVLNINSASGVITVRNGTANYEDPNNTDHRYSVTVIATDSNGNSSSKPVSIAIRNVEEPTQLKAGVSGIGRVSVVTGGSAINEDIAQDFEDPDGSAFRTKITYSVVGGTLPAGISLTPAGLLIGTSSASSATVTIMASDGVSNGNDATRAYEIKVLNAPGIIGASMSDASEDPLIGKASDSVTLNVTLSEVVTASAALTSSNIEAAISTSDNGTAVAFTVSSASLTTVDSNSVVVINGTLSSSTLNSSNLVFTRLSLTGISLVGATTRGNLNASQAVSYETGYQLDSTLPTISSVSSLKNADGNYEINVTFSEVLRDAVPAASAFGLFASNGTTSLSGISIANVAFVDSTHLKLTTTGSTSASEYRLKYTPPNSNALSDLAGNRLATVTLASQAWTGVNLSAISSEVGGFVMRGALSNDVSGLGDINGDGLEDILIVSPDSPTVSIPGTGTNTLESAYVVYGKATTAAIDLNNLGSAGFKMSYTTPGKNKPVSASSLADINGDGLNDMLFAAWGANKAYVIYGKTGNAQIDLDNVTSAQGFVINGISGRPNITEIDVAGLGDINGDGRVDFALGQPWVNNFSGRVYVALGTSNLGNLDASHLAAGTDGFEIVPEGNADGLTRVSSLGDVNGDGLADILVGAVAAINAGVETGKAYVLYGRTGTSLSNINLSAVAAGTGGFAINGINANDNIGGSMSGIGDVNGDGLADIAVAAPSSNISGVNNVGKSYVIFGKTSTSAVDLSNLATKGFVLIGESAEDKSGSALSAAGDINGDGLADFLVAARFASANGNMLAGKTYLIYGKSTNTDIQLSNVTNGTGGFVIKGERVGDGNSQILVSAGGDINGDGFDDLLVISGTGSNSPTYVIFGGTGIAGNSMPGLVQGTNVSGPSDNNDYVLVGTSGNDTLTTALHNGIPRFFGGAGNDEIAVTFNITSASYLANKSPSGVKAHIDGGTGLDTIKPLGVTVANAITLDMTLIPLVGAGSPVIDSRVESIERFNLQEDSRFGSNVPNKLIIDTAHILDMTGLNTFNTIAGHAGSVTGTGLGNLVDKHQLMVSGSAGSSSQFNNVLDLTDFDQWTKAVTGGTANTVTWSGGTYEIWNHNSLPAQILVQQGVSVI